MSSKNSAKSFFTKIFVLQYLLQVLWKWIYDSFWNIVYIVLSLGQGLFFAYEYSIDPITFVEKGLSLPIQLLFTLVKNQSDIFVWRFFWVRYYDPLIVCVSARTTLSWLLQR